MKWIHPLYPLHCLHELGSDFAGCVAHTLETKDALVGPVVLSAMAAAVHGVLDIYTPTHRMMPTSLYVSVIAGSGLGKSASVNCAYQGFRDFEAGCEGRFAGKDGFDPSQGHPYRLDDASESGVIALFGSGAKAMAMVLDEGGALAKHLDLPGMCKRYDGDDLRFLRKHEMIQIRDTRTTFCMTVQDAVFDQLLKGKQGALMVPSGLMPRMLLSYATDSVQHISLGVRDLEAFYNSSEGKEAIGSRSLYLLRNADREGKGLGFALAGNFYPDFLLWLVDDASGKQWLTFVDPKGLRNLDLSHPKLGLHKEVKTLETTLAGQAKAGEAPLVLNAFILSPTKFADLLNVGDPTKKADLESRNVLFMEEGGSIYLKKLFAALA
ncbi:YfjI family protein [Comamonas aquatica]|uniref:DUF3987 domain-containing protein n=1 Tax=Comamonas aquatica TaxID=225991 RepID=UPI0024468941|nr:DUF3987 domain-containing protein [Comamonas aquatica]MDH1765583.1 YfjI family protein [Comamonas aquatica]